MANKFSIKDANPQIRFPFTVAEEVEKTFSGASQKEKAETISRILTNNNVKHTILHDMVVVHDLRIMDECCEFAWYMDLAAIAAIQMTDTIIAKVITCPFSTIICQEGLEILPVYTASGSVIVVEKVFDELPNSGEQKYQIIDLSSDARMLEEGSI